MKSRLLLLILALSTLLCGCKSTKVTNDVEYDLYVQVLDYSTMYNRITVIPAYNDFSVSTGKLLTRKVDVKRDFFIDSSKMKDDAIFEEGANYDIHVVNGKVTGAKKVNFEFIENRPNNNSIVREIYNGKNASMLISLPNIFSYINTFNNELVNAVDVTVDIADTLDKEKRIETHEAVIVLPDGVDYHYYEIELIKDGVNTEFLITDDEWKNYFVYYSVANRRVEVHFIAGELEFIGDGKIKVINPYDGPTPKDSYISYQIFKDDEDNNSVSEAIDAKMIVDIPAKGDVFEYGSAGIWKK